MGLILELAVVVGGGAVAGANSTPLTIPLSENNKLPDH